MMISPPAAPTEDSLVGLLVLSPNEEARRRQLDNQQERIRRLLEVKHQYVKKKRGQSMGSTDPSDLLLPNQYPFKKGPQTAKGDFTEKTGRI